MDGYLTVEEIKTFLTTLGDKLNEDEALDLIKYVDKKNKGVIGCDGKFKPECNFVLITFRLLP